MTDRKKLEEIIAGCEGVTPGPWHLGGPDQRDGLSSWLLHGMPEGMLAVIREEHQGRHFGPANAAHIARLDPQTVKAMTERIIELERYLEFIARWAWRDSPRLTDDERLSAIKYYPPIRVLALEKETHDAE